MKNYINFFKAIFPIFFIGILFSSCQKEETPTLQNNTTASNLKEPPFTNYMVLTQDAQWTKAAENTLKLSDAKVIRTVPETGMAIVQSKDPDFINNTLKSPEFIAAVPDYEIKWIPSGPTEMVNPGNSIGNTEFFFAQGYLWGLDAIDAPEAWNAGYTGKGATVFILDSGIDAENPEYAQNLNTSLSTSFVPGEDYNIRPGQYFNHGTHVAGTIAAAQNGLGIIGVAPNAEIVAVKVLSELTGSGAFSSINAGIVYAGLKGADVVNMSLGATLYKNGKLVDADGNPYKIPGKYIQEIVLAQQRAIDYASSQGVTIITSAGNDATDGDGDGSRIVLPAGLNNVVSISATAPENYNFDPTANYDIPASYTNYGRSAIDLAAPGGDTVYSIYDAVLSTGSDGSYYFASGTSMAAPHVSGVAALLIGKNGGQMDPHEVVKQLEKTADNIDGNGQSIYFGKGRVNALRAVTE